MSLGNCLEWKIKHFSYCCRYIQICMLDIYSYTMWWICDNIWESSKFFSFCILQSNSTLTSSYLSTPSIFLYQVQRECARTLTIVAALLYLINVIVEVRYHLVECWVMKSSKLLMKSLKLVIRPAPTQTYIFILFY